MEKKQYIMPTCEAYEVKADEFFLKQSANTVNIDEVNTIVNGGTSDGTVTSADAKGNDGF